ncbi:MAG: T9SS type A sorting domain-containing protein [Bacteroidales bacterium]|nr:T9SS type A sorting domain-containing protein [Bacteroidales bacterium]MCF8457506.1 T9SS type A sorting domain-containing protein [Bacteroidales bacterium]
MKKSTIFLSLFMMLAVCVNSQTLKVFEEWTTSNGTQNMFLETFTETDASRNVYVGGATVNSSGDYDILLTKYDSRGNLQWTEQYTGAGNGDDAAAAICFGDSGYAYLTGTVYTSANNQNDCVVLKYDQYGNLMWARTYNGNAYGPDFGTDICIDASNNVYIGGASTRTGTYYDFLVLKYDRGGVYQWVSFYDNLHFFEIANKIELNGSTVVVAGGTQVNATKWEYAVANFDSSNGTFKGVKTTTSTGTGIDQINDLCIDGSGNLYVTGGVVNANTGYDYQTVKLNDSLDVQWTATYNNTDSLDDVARSIQVDASGNVYVTGYSLTQDEDTNIVTIKYNSSGAQQWVEEYNDDDYGCDKGEALIVDGSGNIFVAATYFNGSNSDYLTLKYNTDGDLIWKMTYNGLYNKNDEAKDICLDNEGDIIVVGQSCIGDDYQYITVKYSEIDVIIPPDDEIAQMAYTANFGQLADTGFNPVPDVKYYTIDSKPVCYFWDDKVSYLLADSNETNGLFDYYRIDMEFIEPASEIKVRAFDELNYYSNFFYSYIPEGRSRVKNYSKVIYNEVFDDIDLLISSNNRGPKLYYIIKPGGTPNIIHCLFTGADSIKVGFNEELILYTELGSIVYPQAKAYQIDSNGDPVNLAWQPEYDLNTNHLFFTIGSYNTSLPLVIEMNNGSALSSNTAIENLEWSSYFGSQFTNINDMISNGSNDVFITGCTNNLGGTMPGPYGYLNTNSGGYDAFIVKINNGIEVIWKTYYGGTGDEISTGIGLNSMGHIFISGYTTSELIPFKEPYGSYYDDENVYCSAGYNNDIFIAEFGIMGDNLLWGTFYGEDCADEKAYDLKFDNLDNLYIVGIGDLTTELCTLSVASNYTVGNGIILKFDSDRARKWVTLFDVDKINSIDCDDSNNIYITGVGTYNSGLTLNNDQDPGHSAITGATPGDDIFVAKFNSNDLLVLYESLGYGEGTGIAVDNSDDIVIKGFTSGSIVVQDYDDNSTLDYYEPIIPYYNPLDIPPSGFISKITGTGAAIGTIVWSSYFGTKSVDRIWNLLIDNNDYIYVVGQTHGGSYIGTTLPFPQTAPIYYYINDDKVGQNLNDDGFIARFNSEQVHMWTTYFGGNGIDDTYTCTVTNNSKLYIAGLTMTDNDNYLNDPDLQIPNIPYDDQNQNVLNDDIFNNCWQYVARFNIFSGPISIETYKSSDNIDIYPNPTEEILNIKLSDKIKGSTEIVVNSVAGKRVKSQLLKASDGEIRIDIKDLRPGVYIVQLINGTNCISKKFIKL